MVRHVTAAVKAFESLKQHSLRNRHKRQVALRTLLHRAATLKAKALRAFGLIIARKHMLAQIRAAMDRKLASRILVVWEHQLQLKLWRKDAFEMFKMLLQKRAFAKWRH